MRPTVQCKCQGLNQEDETQSLLSSSSDCCRDFSGSQTKTTQLKQTLNQVKSWGTNPWEWSHSRMSLFSEYSLQIECPSGNDSIKRMRHLKLQSSFCVHISFFFLSSNRLKASFRSLFSWSLRLLPSSICLLSRESLSFLKRRHAREKRKD